jgi:hypothetical protein
MSPDGPDLFAEPLHGLRAWQVLEDGRLFGVAKPVFWEPRCATQAFCLESEEHEAPAPGCGCGLYAYHPAAWPARRLARHRDRVWVSGRQLVVGVMEAWGQVELHADGFRAEWARPKAFVSFSDDKRTRYSFAKRAADEHGVEFLCVKDPGELQPRMDDLGWRSFERRQAERLVVAASEVVLARRVAAHFEDGVAVAGEGFALVDPDAPLGTSIRPRRGRTPGATVFVPEGLADHAEALRDRRFDPGRPVRLVVEANDLADRRAISIWDERGEVRLGYVPRRLRGRMRRYLDGGEVTDARVQWQWRRLSTGERYELLVLVARSPVRLADRETQRASELAL